MTITIQSMISRAVDIVDQQYTAFPEALKDAVFEEALDARCNLIEYVADRLYAYTKKKVGDELSHDTAAHDPKLGDRK